MGREPQEKQSVEIMPGNKKKKKKNRQNKTSVLDSDRYLLRSRRTPKRVDSPYKNAKIFQRCEAVECNR